MEDPQPVGRTTEYWETAAYINIASASYDPENDVVTVCFEDGDCVALAPWRLVGRGARAVAWDRLRVDAPMHLHIPTSGEPIEIPGFTIRAITDPIFAAHLAGAAAERARRIGSRLKELRQARGLTTQQLGERIGMAQQNVSRIEQGRHSVPYATLEKILAALGYTLADLSEPAGMAVAGNH